MQQRGSGAGQASPSSWQLCAGHCHWLPLTKSGCRPGLSGCTPACRREQHQSWQSAGRLQTQPCVQTLQMHKMTGEQALTRWGCRPGSLGCTRACKGGSRGQGAPGVSTWHCSMMLVRKERRCPGIIPAQGAAIPLRSGRVAGARGAASRGWAGRDSQHGQAWRSRGACTACNAATCHRSAQDTREPPPPVAWASRGVAGAGGRVAGACGAVAGRRGGVARAGGGPGAEHDTPLADGAEHDVVIEG